MKTIPSKFMNAVVSISLLLPLVTHAGEKLQSLKLKDGKEFKDVEITGVSERGVRILHSSGAANVPIDQLPKELAAKYADAQAKAVDEAAAKEATSKEAAAKQNAEKTHVEPAPTSPMPSSPNAEDKTAVPASSSPKSPPQLVTGKIYGLAEVMADVYKLDGKIVRVEVIPNTASKIEAVGPDLYRLFVGDPSADDDSDYVYMSFPSEGRAKIETMLRGRRGKMTLYMEVRADAKYQIHAVGRSTASGAPGKPIVIRW